VSSASTVGVVLTLAALSGVGSLVGGVLLLRKARGVARAPHLAHAFAAGVLLAAVCFDLLPEAWAGAGAAGAAGFNTLVLSVLMGLVAFGLLEFFCRGHPSATVPPDDRPTVPLIVVGDSVHNLVDGAAIAAGFLADPALGLLTAVAVAAHEIPQEIADFSVLLGAGMSAPRVLLVNALSALTAVAGGALVLALGDLVAPRLPALLGLTAGFFLYLVWHLLRDLRRTAWPAHAGSFGCGFALLVAVSLGLAALPLR
jgi:zinc and cadmium transporter